MESIKVDANFIETALIKESSFLSQTILDLHCKEKAIEDLMQGLREKDMPLSEMLKAQRVLAKK